MTDYSSTPDHVMVAIASNTASRLVDWEWVLADARERVARAEDAIAALTAERDEQYLALDERDLMPVEPIRIRPGTASSSSREENDHG